MRGQLGQLMQQAQRMQEDMKRAQEEIAKVGAVDGETNQKAVPG